MRFPSREEIQLSMDHRSICKAIYSYPTELGISNLGSRISSPVQGDQINFKE